MTMTARPLGSSDPKGINMTVQSENEMADLFVMRLVVYFRRQPKRLGIYYVQRVQSGMEAIDHAFTCCAANTERVEKSTGKRTLHIFAVIQELQTHTPLATSVPSASLLNCWAMPSSASVNCLRRPR